MPYGRLSINVKCRKVIVKPGEKNKMQKKIGCKKRCFGHGFSEDFFLQLTTLEGKIFLNWCSSSICDGTNNIHPKLT